MVALGFTGSEDLEVKQEELNKHLETLNMTLKTKSDQIAALESEQAKLQTELTNATTALAAANKKLADEPATTQTATTKDPVIKTGQEVDPWAEHLKNNESEYAAHEAAIGR